MEGRWGQDENAAAGKFGFEVDNTIGGTPQPNGWMDSWPAFFRERRLLHQLRLAGDPQLTQMGRVLADNLDSLFEGIEVCVRVCSLCWVVFALGWVPWDLCHAAGSRCTSLEG